MVSKFNNGILRPKGHENKTYPIRAYLTVMVVKSSSVDNIWIIYPGIISLSFSTGLIGMAMSSPEVSMK